MSIQINGTPVRRWPYEQASVIRCVSIELRPDDPMYDLHRAWSKLFDRGEDNKVVYEVEYFGTMIYLFFKDGYVHIGPCVTGYAGGKQPGKFDTIKHQKDNK